MKDQPVVNLLSVIYLRFSDLKCALATFPLCCTSKQNLLIYFWPFSNFCRQNLLYQKCLKDCFYPASWFAVFEYSHILPFTHSSLIFWSDFPDLAHSMAIM